MRALSVTRIAIAFLALTGPSPPALAAASESVLHSFKTCKSAYPLGRLRFINGALYGSSAGYPEAPTFGQIFQLTKLSGSWKKTTLHTTWVETVLHSFANNAGDGWQPYAGILMAGTDTFYGTTSAGGNAGGDGTVFKLSPSGGKMDGNRSAHLPL